MYEEEGSPEDKNEDEDGLIEEIEEHKEMVSSTCPHFENSYDILGLMEENGWILEDDYYWKFLGTSIYDYSRPSNVISKNLREITNISNHSKEKKETVWIKSSHIFIQLPNDMMKSLSMSFLYLGIGITKI